MLAAHGKRRHINRNKRNKRYLGFHVPKPRSEYEARSIGGIRINLDRLGLFNVHLNLTTRAPLHFTHIERWSPRPGSNPRSQQRNAIATNLPQRVNRYRRFDSIASENYVY